MLSRFVVSSAASWDMLPSDHACLLIGLTSHAVSPGPAPLTPAPVTTCRLGRAVWGKAALCNQALDLVLPVLREAASLLDHVATSVGLLFITHSVYLAFAVVAELWRAWPPPMVPTYTYVYRSFQHTVDMVPSLCLSACWLCIHHYKYNVATCLALCRTLIHAQWHHGLLHRILTSPSAPAPCPCPLA